MKAIAVIPARSGSGRLKNKNIKPFFGHPLMAYAISAARNSGCFERVVLTTDSEAYAEVGLHYGAEALIRPPELATATADLIGVAEHVIDYVRADGAEPDTYCQLMPCCPLRNAQHVRDHLALFERGERAFQLSMLDYVATYPHWALKRADDGTVVHLWGKENVRRSQELAAAYCPSGALWIVRIAPFLRQRAFYGEPLHGEVLPMPAGVDIDTAEDFEFAKVLVEGYRAALGIDVLEPITISPWQG